LSTLKKARCDLALAYRILGMLGLDDLTYTHLSARIPGKSDEFLIYPFGQLFSEVTPSSLLRVNLKGRILEGEEFQYNATGYAIHGALYQHRPNIQAIFHLHTIAGVSVSSMKCGLLPMSQFAFHFYNRVGYCPYNSLITDPHTQGKSLIEALGDKWVMFLENHGTLTCGQTLQEAFFYTYYLEKACQVQCQVLAANATSPIYPTAEVCEKAAQDMRNFEPNLGQRDWIALSRKACNAYPDVKNFFRNSHSKNKSLTDII
jgi:ribulose-5-phosphate 4-epimerase/fuculose-1-phosphate aldolase